MLGDLSRVPDEFRFKIDAALVGEHENRSQAVRQFMAEPGLTGIDGSNAGMRLDQLRQIADVPHEAKRQLLSSPDTTVALGLELFVKRVQLKGRLLEIAEFHGLRSPRPIKPTRSASSP
jgi:hypothetical protein